MTVSELIKQLQKFDNDAIINVSIDHEDIYPPEEIEISTHPELNEICINID